MSEAKNVTRQDHYHEIQSKQTRSFFETPEYLEYRRQWLANPDEGMVPNLPINLDVHVSNKCNLACSFCPRTWHDQSGGFPEYGNMTWELFTRMTDEAAAGGVKAFHFTANGEPLLHKGLEDMIVYARKAGILEILMHTNATMLTEKRARSLLKAGIHRFIVSFDSPNKETYEKLRVGAQYERTLENIKRFVQLRDELSYDLPTVRIQMVDQKANRHEREQFDTMFGEIADSTSHAYYVPYQGGPTAFVPESQIKAEDLEFARREINPDFKCKYLWQRLIVEWDGMCHPCFYGFDLPVGDLREESLHDVWHGAKMTELRRLHSIGRYCENPTCNKCGRQFETIEEDASNTGDVV